MRTQDGVELTIRPIPLGGDKKNHRIALLSVVFGDKYPTVPPTSVVVKGLKGMNETHVKEVQDIVDKAVSLPSCDVH